MRKLNWSIGVTLDHLHYYHGAFPLLYNLDKEEALKIAEKQFNKLKSNKIYSDMLNWVIQPINSNPQERAFAMDYKETSNVITKWLEDKRIAAGMQGFVVGVSGGIDSALVSTLCTLTGAPVFLLNMPINQAKDQYIRAENHIKWLISKYTNVSTACVDLSESFGRLKYDLNALARNQKEGVVEMTELALANAKARLRMTTLYAYANSLNSLVAGTGNKVEDFGVGFFTKYGDGGVDLSPIGDLLKSEVREMAAFLGVDNDIVTAVPTDGLWGDNRSDESQIGCSYAELEGALTFCEREDLQTLDEYIIMKNRGAYPKMTAEFDRVLQIYLTRHTTSKHKMDMPPVCHLYE